MKRKPETVKDLARRLAAEFARSGKHDQTIDIHREWAPVPELGISSKLSDDLIEFHGRVSRAIPDDIGFSIIFDDGEIFGSIEFDDGPMAGGGQEMPVEFNRHFLANLRAIDWTTIRGGIMDMTQSFDGWTSPDAGPVPEWFKEHIRQGGR